MKDKILKIVTRFYLNSDDFNGIGIHNLTNKIKKVNKILQNYGNHRI
jgi:hypothetical protein